ncbi:MAG TPA: hypothetical protein VJK06_05990 [Methyloceanibacter sp.]|nr:hypothetical protein [Methyloceanibacter sp.]
MTIPPPDYREELDIVRIDPLVLERQRARYANRGITFLALLNGVAALILLASLTQLAPQVEDASKVVGAMLVFGSGALVALGSTFFAYLRRMPRMQAPDRVPVRSGLWWLSLLGAVAGATCFLVGLNMAGRAVTPELETKATFSSEPPQTTVRQRKANKAVIRSLQQRLKDRNASERAKKREERKGSGDEPAAKDSETDTVTPSAPSSAPPAPETAAPPEAEPATPPAAEAPETPMAPQPDETPIVGGETTPQPLTRDTCKNWNESANVCDD